MKTYMSKLTTHVERNLSRVLPDSFPLVFVRQTTPEAYYVAAIANFPANDKKRFDSVCLAFSLLDDETTHDVHEYDQFLSFVIGLFGKSNEGIVAFAGDNCNINRAISNHVDVPLIGSTSHRFQLAAR